MPKTKISDKYQVVIPKPVRERLKLKEGQELNVYTAGRIIVLSPVTDRKWPDDYIGSEQDIWGKIDVAKYLEDERNSWN